MCHGWGIQGRGEGGTWLKGADGTYNKFNYCIFNKHNYGNVAPYKIPKVLCYTPLFSNTFHGWITLHRFYILRKMCGTSSV